MILITGPSGCGKDTVGDKLRREGKRVASFDGIGSMLKGADGKSVWIIRADDVLRVVASQKYDYCLGVSANIVEWIHLFDELIIPRIDLATAKLVCAAKQAANDAEMDAKGKPHREWWPEPKSIEEYYGGNGFWLKPEPYHFKGKVTLMDNSHDTNAAHAWSEWDEANSADTKRLRDELRRIAGYVKDAPYSQLAPWTVQEIEAKQPWTPFKSVHADNHD